MISRQELKNMREKAVKLLQKELGDDYLVEGGTGTYGETAEFKIQVAKADKDGHIATKGEVDFRYHAASVGLDPDDFGGVFSSNGSRYEITGFKARNRKYPIIAKNVATGKTYKFHEASVKTAKRMGSSFWQPAE